MSKRRELDKYHTRDEWITRQLLERVDISGSVMELCVGEWDIFNVLRPNLNITSLYSNDIDPNVQAGYNFDATQGITYNPYGQFPCFPSVDWYITNPPYNAAAKIIPLAYEHARVGIAMLLRLSYLEPCTKTRRKDGVKRGYWLAKNPPTDLIILPRYSYTGDGKTDSVTCAWMVWDKRQIMKADVPEGVIGVHGEGYKLIMPRYQRIICVPEE